MKRVGLLIAILAARGYGQQNPAYDATEHTWRQGIAAHGGTSVARNLSDTDADWLTFINPLGTAPESGTITITEAHVTLADTDTSGTDEWQRCELALFTKSGSTFTKVSGQALTDVPDIAGTPTAWDKTGLSYTVSVTAASEYWWAFGIQGRASHGASKPKMRAVNASGPSVSYVYNSTAVVAGADGYLPATIDATAANGSPGSNGNHQIGNIVFTTTIRRPFVVGSDGSDVYTGTGISYVIPRRTNAPWWAVFRNVEVADGQALTINCNRDSQAGGVTTVVSGVVDFGTTDQMTCDTDAVSAANVALTGQAGNQLDLAFLVRPTAPAADLFWTNKTSGQGTQSTVDWCTTGHKSAAAASRSNAGYTTGSTPPEWISISGSATFDQMSVADAMVVYAGDSMLGKNNWGVGAGQNERIALYLHDALTHPLPWWQSSRANKKLSGDIAGGSGQSSVANLYKHGTPGKGDLADMWSILLVLHCGGNDMTEGEVSTIDGRNTRLALMAQSMGTILTDAVNGRGNRVLVIGMPPYLAPGAAALNQAAFRMWDESLRGLTRSCGVAYYEPYPLAWATYNNVGLGPPDGMQNTDGIHYRTDGGPGGVVASLIVARAAAAAYEGNAQGIATTQPTQSMGGKIR